MKGDWVDHGQSEAQGRRQLKDDQGDQIGEDRQGDLECQCECDDQIDAHQSGENCQVLRECQCECGDQKPDQRQAKCQCDHCDQIEEDQRRGDQRRGRGPR